MLLTEKNQQGAYYLIFDDIYFEELKKDTIITREIVTVAKKIQKSFNVLKYITFNVKDKYSTQQIYELVQLLRKDASIIATIFNPTIKEVFLLFISNKDDSLLEYHIKTFLDLEVIDI